jgi:hypothetical protein
MPDQRPSAQDLVGKWVRGEVLGWRESRHGDNSAPLLNGVPLHAYGELSTRQSLGGTTYCIGADDLVDKTIVSVEEGVRYPRPDYTFVPEAVDKAYPYRGRLRELQSWYREYVLALPAGMHRRGNTEREVHSRLTHEDVIADPYLNFLVESEIESLAAERLDNAHRWGGIVNRDRLYRDLLSSQPLAFNLFGFFKVEVPEYPESPEGVALLQVLREVFAVDADVVTEIRLEYAPPRSSSSKSGSAFDCFIAYRRGAKKGFVGIEVKYSEDLRAQKPTANNPEYRDLTERPGSGFKAGAADVLNEATTCQLWYNACLALRIRDSEDYDEYTLVMTSVDDDESAKAAVERVKDQLTDPEQMRWVGYREIVEVCRRQDELDAWADHFTQRYLDLSPLRHN